MMPAYELHEPLRVCAVTDRDETSLARSASGGAFAVLARATIACNGIVYGSALEDDGTVHHVRVSAVKELERLQGSKYVWSALEGCFASCVEDLRSGHIVLFSGVPCQIAALKAYIFRSDLSAEQQNKLLTCDLICHGTPKQELFRAYLAWLSSHVGADDGIHGYQFRTKQFGWGMYYYYYYYYRKGKRFEARGGAGDDPYYYAFSRGIIYRKCCYSCSFAQTERVGDFTIGDFWGVREQMSEAYRRNGVSAVLINSEKANNFFNKYAVKECHSFDASLDMVRKQQTNLDRPTFRSKEDEALAKMVDKALAENEFDLIFDSLLPIDNSRNARLRRLLPPFILRLLYRFRSAA